ncbi:MAG: DUF4147 domain-containing protein [Gammaproteobacteria bacterium]|nr:DUF4147 domain-containing protein [Gammaproteobacteria bacterium]
MNRAEVENVALAAREFLHGLFDAALQAALPERVVPAALGAAPTGQVLVLGAGKASASMARAVETAWPEAELSGLVVTRYGHGVPCRRIEIVTAAHPLPDAAGQRAAARMLELAMRAGAGDTVLCLISGGASALLSLPAAGVSFAEKQDLNAQLLKCGAPINEMNAVRKRLSAIKGGRLAAAIAPAAARSLLISDVPGDDPAVIGSGPTVPDTDDAQKALDILHRYAISVPDHVRSVMRSNNSIGQLLDNQEVRVIAAPQQSLEAAAAHAESMGVAPLILGDAIQGEAREVGRAFAGIARQIRQHGQPLPAPCVLLSGGETTVTVRGGGRGGRNSEFALGLALALEGEQGVSAIACDTDGIDGSEDNAGAVVFADTLARAAKAGVHAWRMLERNDAYGVFEVIDDLVVTGPTLTNVNDFRAIYVSG